MSHTGLTVLQFTDTHIYADEARLFARINTRSSFTSTMTKALAACPDCDVILVTGDLAADCEAPAYAWLAEQFAVFEAPVFYLPGNHDDADIMDPILGAAGWVRSGSHTLGGWHIVLLDSCVRGEAYGRLGHAEIERLDAALAQHRKLPALVSLHHHPVPIESRWMDTMRLHNADELWAVIDKHPQVRSVLWGHVHQNYDAYRHGVRLLATPSTCVQFAPRSVNFATDPLAPGFRRLILSADGQMMTDIVRV
jgi:Icc protein